MTAGQTIGNNVATLNTGIPTFSGIVLAGGNFNANGVAVPYGTLSGSGSVLNPDANATLSGGIRVTAAELLSDGWSGIAFDGPLSLGGEAKVTIDDPEALDRNGVYRILTTTAALNVQSLPVEGDASGRWQTRLTSDGKGLELYRTRRGLLLVVQ